MTAKTVFRLFLRSCLLLAIASGSGAGGLYRATGAVASNTANLFPGPGVPPFLIFSDPVNGATGVSVNTPIKFTFTTDMATDNRVAWSPNVNTADLVCTQSADKTELTCTPTTGWPVGLITWDLSSFKSADGTPILALNVQGKFTTSSGSSTNNPCDNPGGSKTAGFSLFKQVRYTQSSVNAPVLEADSPASLGVSLVSPSTNSVTQATLKVPSGSTSTLMNFFGTFFLFDNFNTQNELDAAYPTGVYTLTVSRQDGTSGSATLTLANNNYPPIPQINNFPATQAIDSALDFVMQWNGFAGATAEDFISITISDQTGVVFQAPDPCVPRLLPNTATSVVIPGNTLQPGKIYDASLSYFSSSRDNSIADIPGSVGFSKTTSFKISTTGGNPVNLAPVVNAGNNQTITLPGTATLSGTITDDNLPNPPGTLTLQWSQVSGPGTATFANASAASTTVSFSQAGTYVLRLSANDSLLSTTGDITITVNPAPQATAPKFTSFIRLPNGAFQVQITGQPGVSYVIEGSTDLAVWVPLKTTSSLTGLIDFADPQASTLLQHFLRVRTAP